MSEADSSESVKPPRPASLIYVAAGIVPTVFLLALSVLIFGEDSSQGANQIALAIGAVIATVIGIKNGHRWKVIEENIVNGIATALPAILILFSVGSLIGVWMLSGTVPLTMFYYGLLLLEPVNPMRACNVLFFVRSAESESQIHSVWPSYLPESASR